VCTYVGYLYVCVRLCMMELDKSERDVRAELSKAQAQVYIHTYIHTYIYIYIYKYILCVCVDVCIKHTHIRNKNKEL
jgi:hypothetical protein